MKNNVPPLNKRHNCKLSKALWNNPKKSYPVLQRIGQSNKYHRYPSIAEAARQTGISETTISNACYGDGGTTRCGQWMFEKNWNLKAGEMNATTAN